MSGDVRCIPKITEFHVIPGKIKKMKVSLAVQVFSHSMAAAIAIMARNSERDISGNFSMEKRAQETSKVLKFFDEIFDSLNGGTFKSSPGKPLKGAVTRYSKHVVFWKKCIEELHNMFFQKEGTQEKVIPPSMKNLINTLEGFIELSDLILSRNIKYFLARSFNQDPLENYFGQIRTHRGRNINPTCSQFKDSYKALLVRNITSPHSLAANCEETFDSSLIQLEDLLMSSNLTESDRSVQLDPSVDIKISRISEHYFERSISKAAMGYVAGFLARKVLKKFKCEQCRIHILEIETGSAYSALTAEKEYNIHNKRLTYCKENFVKCINKIYNITRYLLSNISIESNVTKYISLYAKKYVQFQFTCSHDDLITNFIINYVINLCIFNFCKGINSLISGKVGNISEKSCSLFKEAHRIYLGRRK